jgi:hypothetical protein
VGACHSLQNLNRVANNNDDQDLDNEPSNLVAGLAELNPCPRTSKQIGEKWGAHKDQYPGMTRQEYGELTDELYTDPSAIRVR